MARRDAGIAGARHRFFSVRPVVSPSVRREGRPEVLMSMTPPATPTVLAADPPPAATALPRRSGSAGPGLLPPAAAAPRRRFWRNVLGGALLFVVIVWSALLLAWLTLHWGILPHIQQWREPIAARASKVLGVPVRIGAIDVRTGGWVPSFELREVVVSDPAGRPALRLPRVFAAISPRSLLSFDLRFDQLLLDAPELEVRRDPSGRLHVAGIELGGPGAAGSSSAADWFFAQREFVIRGGALRWIDEQRGAPPLVLTDLRLVLRNGLARHDLRIDATPPSEWGDRFTAIGRFTQPLFTARGDWRRWSGEAYVDLPRSAVGALARHVDLPFELRQGAGALRAWVGVHDGVPDEATVDLDLHAVTVRLAADLEPLAVQAVEGRVTGRRRAGTLELTLRRFTFATADGQHWPRGDATFSWRRPDAGVAESGRVTAERLDLGVIAEVAARLPLGAAPRRLLAELAPKGRLDGLDARWSGPLDAPTAYRVRGRLRQAALAARPAPVADKLGRPGVRGADLSFEANERGGTGHLTLDGGTLDLPGVFAEPVLPLDRLDAHFDWSITPAADPAAPPALAVELRSARFANADASGAATGRWRSGGGSGNSTRSAEARFPGHLELDATLANAVGARVPRYLPLGLPAKTRAYLGQAIRAGQVSNASFHVAGDLRDFPFLETRPSGGRGEFRVAAHVDAAEFAYVPDTGHEPAWPVLSRGEVDLRLEGRTLLLQNLKGRIGGVDFAPANGALTDLGGHPVFSLEAHSQAPLGELLRIVNTTPISRWIDRTLERSTATGSAELQIRLALPLDRIEAASVHGSVVLGGNDLRILPETPLLGAARGRVDFTTKGFTLVGTSARLFGGEAAVEGGTQADGSVRFSAQGSVTAEGLRRALELGPVARIAGALAGQTRVRATLGFVRGQPDYTVTSDLVGMRIELPAPLAKPAEAALALRVSQLVDPAAGPLRDTLRVDLGTLFQANWTRELGGAEPRVLRGGIGVLLPAPQPAAGVAAALALPRFAASDWEAAAERLFAGPAASAAGPGDPPPATGVPAVSVAGAASAGAGTGVGTGARADPGARPTPGTPPTTTATANAYLPDTVALSTAELVYGTRRLTHVSAGLSRNGALWRANVAADQLSGYLEYRTPSARGAGAPAGAGRLYARLARLVLPDDADGAQVESLLDAQPATLPALDVVVDDFELRGRRLGRVQIEAVNRPGSQGRDWQLARLDITTPEASLSATGQWAVPGGAAPRRTTLDFRLQIGDSGALLARFGTPGALRGGKGALTGQVGWTGSPFALDYPTLSGSVAIAIESGQFLKVDPGAARLLGVLSLQSLPRRLSLDFRDLFGQGFAFDAIDGDLTIAHGIASTRNLRMRGVQAAVLMEGSADIAHETQDVRVVVVPELSAGTAALAYAVINPVLGLGAFLAQAILKKPLSAAGTREFHVSGPWADPKVERVARGPGDDAAPSTPDAATNSLPAPAASAPLQPATAAPR